jgi:hypothetical protein
VRRRSTAVIALAVIGALAAVAGDSASNAQSAEAASCEYVRRGKVLRIEQATPQAPIKVRRRGLRIAVLRTRRPYPPMAVRCQGGSPTVHNVDRIDFLATRTSKLHLDLAAGPLAPGASERGRGAEIEIFLRSLVPDADGPMVRLRVASGDRPNRMVLGRLGASDGINLNPARERRDDPDVYLGRSDPQGSSITILPRGGADSVSALGGRTFAGPLGDVTVAVEAEAGRDRLTGSSLAMAYLLGGNDPDRLVAAGLGGSLYGMAGDDLLIGRAGSDGMRPGGGEDTIRANGGVDLVGAADGRADRIDCGAGDDRAVVDARDRHIGCERVFVR